MTPSNAIPPHNSPADPFAHPGQWFVLHAKSRQEKALSRDLTAHRIAHFLPLRPEVHYHGKRKCLVQVPLFSNYMFLKGQPDDSYIADRTGRVANIIRVPNQPQLHRELINIHQALLQNAPVMMYPYLAKGTNVQVREGPYRGTQGVIDKRKKGNRLILQIQSLGQAICIEVDASLLDVIPDNN